MTSYIHLGLILEAIERRATTSQTRRLRLQDSVGSTVGRLTLEGGLIQFGIECAGHPYVDKTFSQELPSYAAPVIKSLHGGELSEFESQLLTKLPISARRAMRAVTARALRHLAALCVRTTDPVQDDGPATSPNRSLRMLFSPSELMMAAGESSEIRLEDAAVIEYEMPPLTPEERWLFEWHGEESGYPWPVKTTRVRDCNTLLLVNKGLYCQRLLRHLPRPIATPGRPVQLTTLLTVDSRLNYLVRSERYAALLIYPVERRERLLRALESPSPRRNTKAVQLDEHTLESSVLHTGEIPSLESGAMSTPSSGKSPNAAEAPSIDAVLPSGESADGPLSGANSADLIDNAWLDLQAASLVLEKEPTPMQEDKPIYVAAKGSSSAELEQSDSNPFTTSQALTPEDQQRSEQFQRLATVADVPSSNPSMEEVMAINGSTIKEILAKLENGIEGYIGAAIADSESGLCLGFSGGAGFLNLEVAAASNTEVVRAKRKAMKALGLRDEIEDMLITLGKQYHLIRPLRTRQTVFIYLALDRGRANLALARYTLAEAEREIIA